MSPELAAQFKKDLQEQIPDYMGYKFATIGPSIPARRYNLVDGEWVPFGPEQMAANLAELNPHYRPVEDGEGVGTRVDETGTYEMILKDGEHVKGKKISDITVYDIIPWLKD
jgi:hypothetical protein